jgi:tRNA threonylcarbamoyladenosine biosynthesis protein TsaE
MCYEANSIHETDKLGRALAEVVPDGLTIGLCGNLGAGKTLLVRSMAEALGVRREDVVSPTFVICQQYEGDRTIYHLDVYRIVDEDEFLNLGPEEFFDSPAITIIEWADRIESCLPANRLIVEIEIVGKEQRRFTFAPHGPKAEQAVREMECLLEQSN